MELQTKTACDKDCSYSWIGISLPVINWLVVMFLIGTLVGYKFIKAQ
jgi:hypothetical protein